jgi:hypothetical protein
MRLGNKRSKDRRNTEVTISPLLLTHNIKCSRCVEFKPISLFPSLQKRRHKNGNDAFCFECMPEVNREKCKLRHIRKNGLYECVVCGHKFPHESLEFGLKGRYSKRSVCSEKCYRFYERAVEYVKEIHGVNTINARNIVVSTWFKRGIKQHEKDIRVQKGNVERNAAA